MQSSVIAFVALCIILSFSTVFATCGIYQLGTYYGNGNQVANQLPIENNYFFSSSSPGSNTPNNAGSTSTYCAPSTTFSTIQSTTGATCTNSSYGHCASGNVTLVITTEAADITFAVAINGVFVPFDAYSGSTAFSGLNGANTVVNLNNIDTANVRIFGENGGDNSIVGGNPLGYNVYGLSDDGTVNSAVTNAPSYVSATQYRLSLTNTQFSCTSGAVNTIVIYTFNALTQAYNTAGGSWYSEWIYANVNSYYRSDQVCAVNPFKVTVPPLCPGHSSSSSSTGRSSSSSSHSSSLHSSSLHSSSVSLSSSPHSSSTPAPHATSSSSGIRGDPQFIGLRGQNFQVHGIDGAVYALISDVNLQLNSRFVYLEGPRPCPVMPSTGKKSVACWSHKGSYLQNLGLLTSAGDRILIESGSAATGYSTVTVNDQIIEIGQQVPFKFITNEINNNNNQTQFGYLIYNNSYEITLITLQYSFEIENSDDFINIRALSIMEYQWNKLNAHGLLGQTYKTIRYSGNKIKEIEGDVDDYTIDGDDMFGTDFVYNKFHLLI